jgi:hypothetical protein
VRNFLTSFGPVRREATASFGPVSAGGDVRNFLTSFGPAPARGNSLVASLDHFGDLPIGFIFRVGLGQPVDKLKFLPRWSGAHDED